MNFFQKYHWQKSEMQRDIIIGTILEALQLEKKEMKSIIFDSSEMKWLRSNEVTVDENYLICVFCHSIAKEWLSRLLM